MYVGGWLCLVLGYDSDEYFLIMYVYNCLVMIIIEILHVHVCFKVDI